METPEQIGVNAPKQIGKYDPGNDEDVFGTVIESRDPEIVSKPRFCGHILRQTDLISKFILGSRSVLSTLNSMPLESVQRQTRYSQMVVTR